MPGKIPVRLFSIQPYAVCCVASELNGCYVHCLTAGSVPLDVAYSSFMDNNELALALKEEELDKVAVYLSRCGLQVRLTSIKICVLDPSAKRLKSNLDFGVFKT